MTSQSPQPSAPLADETEITVCSECLMASCWQGTFMCDSSRDAGTVKATVRLLRFLGHENESYWSKSIASAPAPQPSSTGGAEHVVIRCDPDGKSRYLPGRAGFATLEQIQAMDEAARETGVRYLSLTSILNSHDALVKALRDHFAAMDATRAYMSAIPDGYQPEQNHLGRLLKAEEEAEASARAALKAATGGN